VSPGSPANSQSPAPFPPWSSVCRFEWADGKKEWFRTGQPLTAEEVAAIQARTKKRDIAAPVMTVTSGGDKMWRNKDGHLHREDGPAFEGADGTDSWYRNGHRHRESYCDSGVLLKAGSSQPPSDADINHGRL
jgi:hypothetical protein